MTKVNGTRGGVRTAILFCVAIVLFAGATGLAKAQGNTENQDKPDLKETVKWAVWHEGCRIYADDNSIGSLADIRECIVDVYAKDADAQQLVRGAKDNVLLDAIRTAGREIPGERQLSQFIEYACKHEQLLDKFYDMENAGDYEGMRTLYYETFKSNEKARNLLAAVSNETLCDMVNVLR